MSPVRRPKTEVCLNLIPKALCNLTPAILAEALSYPNDLDVKDLDGYRPWELVTARLEENQQGQSVLAIKDDYLPPAQTGDAEPFDSEKMIPGYNLLQLGPKCATPSMVLFENQQSTHGAENDRQKWVESWQNRMGVRWTNGPHTKPFISMIKIEGDQVVKGSNHFSFPKVSYDSAVSCPYGVISESGLKNVGYASVLLYHHLEKFFPELEPGNYIYVQSISGKEEDFRSFFIVEKKDKGFNIKITADELLTAICNDTEVELEEIEARAWADYAKAKETGGDTKMYLEKAKGENKIDWSCLAKQGDHVVYRIIEFYTDFTSEEVVDQLVSTQVKFAHPDDSVEWKGE
ncbi:MAG: hypothetical protein U9O78_03645 [Patescibacteria group bacterium]|nr:hypothetical protein [Patescibacteria group bacterium]